MADRIVARMRAVIDGLDALDRKVADAEQRLQAELPIDIVRRVDLRFGRLYTAERSRSIPLRVARIEALIEERKRGAR